MSANQQEAQITAMITGSIMGTLIPITMTMIMNPMSIDAVTRSEEMPLPSSQALKGAALVRLLTWLSPAFPLGSFSYSHGLETAISEGICHDRESVGDWLGHLLTMGSARSDAILLAHGWRIGAGDRAAWIALNELALALCASRERHMETSQQGMAFFRASAAWPGPLQEQIEAAAPEAIALPVILGATARENDIGLDSILIASLHTFSSNLISVAMRLVPLGQSDGLRLQAQLEATIIATATEAATASLDNLGTSCFHSDIAAMRHETLHTRIFRS
nr:urease accessory UreF family protein [uncultured Cohaesibacter sp.]